MSAEQHQEEHGSPSVNLLDYFKEDYERLQNERFLPDESVKTALDCLFIDRFGYTVATSHRLFTVSFQPHFGLSGPVASQVYGLGLLFPLTQETLFTGFAGGIGRAYRFPDKDLTQRQMNSRVVRELSLKSITDVNMRNLCVRKKGFSLEKLVFTQVLPVSLVNRSTSLEQPIFLDADQGTSLYKLLVAGIFKSQTGDNTEIKPRP